MLVWMNAFNNKQSRAEKPETLTDEEFALVEQKFREGKGFDVAEIVLRIIDAPHLSDCFLVVGESSSAG